MNKFKLTFINVMSLVSTACVVAGTIKLFKDSREQAKLREETRRDLEAIKALWVENSKIPESK